MNVPRLLRVLLCACFSLGLVVPALADTYPSKSILLILPFAPGGASDGLARILAPKLSEELGQSVVVENRGGAGGNLAANLVATSSPDGYTVLMASAMLTTNKFLYKTLPFDPEKDFAPVTLLANGPYVLLASPALPVNNLGELIEYSKSHPLFYASSGIGGAAHLAGELLKLQTGLRMTHVPFRGGGPAVAAVLTGSPELVFATIASSISYIKAGTLKAIGMSGSTRAPQLPDVPTLDEEGAKGYNVITWDSLAVPAATPKPVVDKLNAAVRKVLRMPEIAAQIRAIGYNPTGSTPEEMTRFLVSERVLWSKIIREADVHVE